MHVSKLYKGQKIRLLSDFDFIHEFAEIFTKVNLLTWSLIPRQQVMHSEIPGQVSPRRVRLMSTESTPERSKDP